MMITYNQPLQQALESVRENPSKGELPMKRRDVIQAGAAAALAAAAPLRNAFAQQKTVWKAAETHKIYSNNPIKAPADLKGMKIRMMGNPIFVETMNAMGGNGVAMGFDQLFSALQTGVVDGAENNPPTLLAQNHNQVSKVYSLTGHLIIPEILVFSKRTWDTLSKADQDLLRKVAREAQTEERGLWDKMVAESTQKLKAAGMQFVDTDKKAFYDATRPIREKYGSKHVALIKRIEDTR